MEERKGFGSTFGFLMAAVGSAVGLGNIWGFPNKMGANGGFTFLIIYLILAALCGFVVMVGELALGRKTGRGVVSAYQVLSKRFKWLGWLGIIAPFLILSFYCALGGYCVKYVVLNVGNIFGAGFGNNGLASGEVFGNMLTNQLESVIYGLIFVLLTLVIVMGGVSGVRCRKKRNRMQRPSPGASQARQASHRASGATATPSAKGFSMRSG
mgnify:CR=1 FL=1